MYQEALRKEIVTPATLLGDLKKYGLEGVELTTEEFFYASDLAINGIKIMLNFRTGCLETMNVLDYYPKGSWYAVGTLGCARGHVRLNEMYLRTKIILTDMNMLIYYGKLKPEYENLLNEMGIPHKVFPDFQRVSRGKGAA